MNAQQDKCYIVSSSYMIDPDKMAVFSSKAKAEQYAASSSLLRMWEVKYNPIPEHECSLCTYQYVVSFHEGQAPTFQHWLLEEKKYEELYFQYHRNTNYTGEDKDTPYAVLWYHVKCKPSEKQEKATEKMHDIIQRHMLRVRKG